MNTISNIYSILGIVAAYIGITTLFYIYKYFSTSGPIKIQYKKRLLHYIVAISIVLVLFILFRLTIGSLLGNSTARIKGSPSFDTTYTSSSNIAGGMPQRPTTSVEDTREFLKKYFSATIQTRDVEPVAKKVEYLIKGSDGRIDSSTINTTNAYFSFVIPKSELDTFEEELRTYTHTKLYTQSVSTQNLLGEKQNLERQQTASTDTVTTLTVEQKKVQTDYAKQAAVYNRELTAAQTELTTVRTSLTTTSDEAVRTSLLAKERTLIAAIQTLQANLAQATTTFRSQMGTLGVSLANQATILKNLSMQEDAFFDNIETVQGSIGINHISLWQWATRLSPIHPVWVIALILALLKIYSVTKKDRQQVVIQ